MNHCECTLYFNKVLLNFHLKTLQVSPGTLTSTFVKDLSVFKPNVINGLMC